jgi:2-C-methyl-D-erythritol 4-phosphate cytidylyltransferase
MILVHDGARPIPSTDMIHRVIDACKNHHGAIPVIPVTDSLRRTDGRPANRGDFRAVQTPQAFQAKLLREAYCQPERPEDTDDASVMTAAGFTDIVLADGDPYNIKITNPLDLKIAELFLQSGNIN